MLWQIVEDLVISPKYYKFRTSCTNVQMYKSWNKNLIKKFIFCDSFNCPPYPSLQETPAELVDDFLLIKNEINKDQLKRKIILNERDKMLTTYSKMYLNKLKSNTMIEINDK